MKTETLIESTNWEIKTFPDTDIVYIRDEQGNVIAEGRNKKYGEMICKAVNNYDSLLNALKDFCDLRTAYSGEDFNKAYHNAKALILKAEQ